MSEVALNTVAQALHAAEQALPTDATHSTEQQLAVAHSAYVAALEGSAADEATQIHEALTHAADTIRSLNGTLEHISRLTETYLGRLGVGAALSSERPPSFRNINEKPHQIARSKVHKTLQKVAKRDHGIEHIARTPLAEEQVPWDADMPDYQPPFIDMPRGNSSARKPDDYTDPADPNAIERFESLEVAEVQRDANGYPINPVGRTGMAGRGILNKWGPTQAADPIVTRNNPQTGKLEALLIKRGDTGDLAIPGGKVDPGETPAQAAGRELTEEAGARGITIDFSDSTVVFAGYVDDPRNTDNAWMESTALHKHLTPEEAEAVTIEAGSDATEAAWMPVTDELYDRLYADHGTYLRRAVTQHQQQQP